MSDAYQEFLESKFRFTHQVGFEIGADAIAPICKAHQVAMIRWAVQKGCAAIFAAFGLGKSVVQIETLRIIQAREGGRTLIIAPLGVRQEFRRDAELLGLGPTHLTFVRRTEEVGGPGAYLTNYESVRDGKLDVSLFTAVSLDEASVLRSFGSKTYQTFLQLFGAVPYRFVATATPSPNRYKELIHYAGFLGVMDTGQALTRFFERDSEKAGNLTLYPHMEAEFFAWLHSWALFLQRPSDLGYSDEGYDLPPLRVVYHEVPAAAVRGRPDRDGVQQLIPDAALSLDAAATEKRESIPQRVAQLQQILAETPAGTHAILWHHLEAERHALDEALPSACYGRWAEYRDGHPDALALYERHYSACAKPEGRERKLFVGPGEKLVLLTQDRRALFAWRRFKDDSGQQGVNCAVFRNEGGLLSSELILEAMAIAWMRWPGERLYTYVDADAVASPNPGYCFKEAGWTACGRTKSGLVILEALAGVSVPHVLRADVSRSVYGSQDLDEREDAIIAFSDGEFQYLSTKPELAGSGCNFQRHCHTAVFLGIDYKFNDFIQAIYRLQRFQQPHEVTVHVIYTSAEREILKALQAKWAEDNVLRDRMSAIIRRVGLDGDALAQEFARTLHVERRAEKGTAFEVVHTDCVPETRAMATDSVDLVVTSIPFGNHYEYSPSYNDFGHNEDHAAFFRQLDFLTPELLRVLAPGRVAAIHVKDRIRFGKVTGYGMSSVEPFHADCIHHFIRHGFIYFGMITVVTDVVRENNQTYRLGWTEQCKDGTKMGVGSPEYVLLFRKLPTDTSKGYADVRVAKTKEEYPLARWQIDAHALWRSSGNRLLTHEELAGYGPDVIGRLYRDHSRGTVYDYESHVALGQGLADRRALPSTFMCLAPAAPPHVEHAVWSDVTRMLTLNGQQTQAGLQNHICPLQFDIVDRLITRFTNPGELVYDPFGGLLTVPLRAIKLGRRGRAAELNADYFADGLRYLRQEEERQAYPSLFDADAMEGAA